MNNFRAVIRNGSEDVLTLHIEPWGDQIPMKPGEGWRVEFSSPKQGEAEIVVETGNVMVYGWEGCLVQFDRQS